MWILDGFWMDFGGFRLDFGSNLDRFWADFGWFWLNFGWLLVDFLVGRLGERHGAPKIVRKCTEIGGVCRSPE